MKNKINFRQKNIRLLFLTLMLFSFSLFLNNCKAISPQDSKPPEENGVFTPSKLVEIVKLDSTIHLDIRYATNNNFVGKAVYPQARAFLQRPAAEALVNVNKALKSYGYGLLIYDGYRPWSVTKLFWDATPKKNKKFVADPKKGSRHNRGCAVDVSLYQIATGVEVEMISQYDEMSERSFPNYKGGTPEQRTLRDLLIRIMKENGFSVYDTEWWHFDYKDWKLYKIENIQFSEI